MEEFTKSLKPQAVKLVRTVTRLRTCSVSLAQHLAYNITYQLIISTSAIFFMKLTYLEDIFQPSSPSVRFETLPLRLVQLRGEGTVIPKLTK